MITGNISKDVQHKRNRDLDTSVAGLWCAACNQVLKRLTARTRLGIPDTSASAGHAPKNASETPAQPKPQTDKGHSHALHTFSLLSFLP